MPTSARSIEQPDTIDNSTTVREILPPSGQRPAKAAIRQPPAIEPVADEPRLGRWQQLAFWIAHATTSALFAVLGLSGLYRFGRTFGTIEWLINHKRRRRFAAALRRVFGDQLRGADRSRWTREHFMHTRCDKLFYLVFDRLPREQALGLLTFDNEPLLQTALARGRGAYTAMAHHGALHVLALLIALRGYKLAGVRDRQEGALRRWVQHRLDVRYPEMGRMRVLFADTFPREIFRCFEEGYVVASAMDVSRVRFEHQKTEEVTIFGERRAFLSGPLRIAIRRGAPALQAFVIPQPGFRYRLELVELLADPSKVADEDAAVEHAMKLYAANVETFVRSWPSLLTRA
jgi:lauroyl/myristoyl acyltransferase